MGDKEDKFHVMFLPYMAPGHMVPMVDIARLFAANSLKVTIITTPSNAITFKNFIDRDKNLGRDITVTTFPFPCAQAGLPEGCENLSAASTPQMSIKFHQGIVLLEPHITSLFRTHKPSCIVSDYLFPWTVDVATELGIPRLAFSGSSFFNLCVSKSIERFRPHDSVLSETELFVVPGLPDQVTIMKSQLPDIVKKTTGFSHFFEKLEEAERMSFGVLVNSFYELESAYVDHFRNVTGIKAWHLGPVSLFNRNKDDKFESTKQNCIRWLDSRKPNSVIYICFGSLNRFSQEQTSEIASALENSSHSFIWVLGKITKSNAKNENEEEEEWWLPQGFEDRMNEKGQGIIIKGWAPQVLILEHRSTGGFLTHCGWNSVLEGVSAGLPMVTWPLFADQFYNEKFVTQVAKFGVAVGSESWKLWASDDSPCVSREKIEMAIRALMSDSEEAAEMRKRAKGLSEMAHNAMGEGGSSSNNLNTLIHEIKMYSNIVPKKAKD